MEDRLPGCGPRPDRQGPAVTDQAAVHCTRRAFTAFPFPIHTSHFPGSSLAILSPPCSSSVESGLLLMVRHFAEHAAGFRRSQSLISRPFVWSTDCIVLMVSMVNT